MTKPHSRESMVSEQTCEVPLVELLESVPATAREMIEIEPQHHRNIPYGRYCQEAAKRIRELEREQQPNETGLLPCPDALWRLEKHFGTLYLVSSNGQVIAPCSEQNIPVTINRHLRLLLDLIGKPPKSSHPDEWNPRAETWHQERLNWQAEVQRLRAALTSSPSAKPTDTLRQPKK